MRVWVNVAVLARTYNLEGGFVARAAANLPFLLEEGMEVAFVPPQIDAPRRATVASVSLRGDGTATVFFDGVADAGAASRLAGCSCLVRRAEVADRLPLAAQAHPWLGWQMVDAQMGPVGQISDIQEGPAQSRLVVRTDAGREVLVPLVEEFIVGEDEGNGRLLVQLPAGLLDL